MATTNFGLSVSSIKSGLKKRNKDKLSIKQRSRRERGRHTVNMTDTRQTHTKLDNRGKSEKERNCQHNKTFKKKIVLTKRFEEI